MAGIRQKAHVLNSIIRLLGVLYYILNISVHASLELESTREHTSEVSNQAQTGIQIRRGFAHMCGHQVLQVAVHTILKDRQECITDGVDFVDLAGLLD